MAKRWEIRRDVRSVHYGGLFGGKPETRYYVGSDRYFLDGDEVTKEEFERAREESDGGFTTSKNPPPEEDRVLPPS